MRMGEIEVREKERLVRKGLGNENSGRLKEMEGHGGPTGARGPRHPHHDITN